MQTEIKNFQILSPSNTHITGAPNTSAQKPSETYGGGTLGDFKEPITTNGIYNIANQEIGVYLQSFNQEDIKPQIAPQNCSNGKTNVSAFDLKFMDEDSPDQIA